MAWNNSPIELYHGTTRANAVRVLADGIDPTKFRRLTDFGPGFYVTTNIEQARIWAQRRATGGSFALGAQEKPAVLRFMIDRVAFGKLETLCFVRPAEDNGFWPLILSCRLAALPADNFHARGQNTFYDVVIGPVALKYSTPPFRAIDEGDQVAFHTSVALALLAGAGQLL